MMLLNEMNVKDRMSISRKSEALGDVTDSKQWDLYEHRAQSRSEQREGENLHCHVL